MTSELYSLSGQMEFLQNACRFQDSEHMRGDWAAVHEFEGKAVAITQDGYRLHVVWHEDFRPLMGKGFPFAASLFGQPFEPTPKVRLVIESAQPDIQYRVNGLLLRRYAQVANTAPFEGMVFISHQSGLYLQVGKGITCLSTTPATPTGNPDGQIVVSAQFIEDALPYFASDVLFSWSSTDPLQAMTLGNLGDCCAYIMPMHPKAHEEADFATLRKLASLMEDEGFV